MSKVPSLPYYTLYEHYNEMAGSSSGKKGSHIRLQKRTADALLKITIPAHKPVKRSTLSHILKQAQIDVDAFLDLL